MTTRGMELILVMAMVIGTWGIFGMTNAQTTHQIGDALGWVVPPDGAAAYASWMSTKTFRVGDTLVFNFNSGTHNVAEVTKEAFDSCNITSPILVSTNSPTTITLSSPGDHFYICTISDHCGLGQKLGINCQ